MVTRKGGREESSTRQRSQPGSRTAGGPLQRPPPAATADYEGGVRSQRGGSTGGRGGREQGSSLDNEGVKQVESQQQQGKLQGRDGELALMQGGGGAPARRRWAPAAPPTPPTPEQMGDRRHPHQQQQQPAIAATSNAAALKLLGYPAHPVAKSPNPQHAPRFASPDAGRADRDTLGYIIKTPQHYRISQFYDHQASPFGKRRSTSAGSGGGGRAAEAGAYAAGKGGERAAGLSRPVSAEAARLAAEAGVLPVHAQMAHEVSQVGTREEGRAAAEAVAAAAAAGSSPGRRPGDGAQTAVVDPASSSSARLLRLAHALEQAEAEHRVAKGGLPVRHQSGGGVQQPPDEPSVGWEADPAGQGVARTPSPVARGARTPSPMATGWGRSRRVFPARPGSSGGGGTGRHEPYMSPAEAALLQQQYGVAVALAAQQRRDAAEANIARHRGLDAEAVPAPGHAMDRRSRRVT